MNRFTRYFLFLFITLFLHEGVSQTDEDVQLAAQFYQNQEYEKAVELYELLYTKKSQELFYGPYLKCLEEIKAYSRAEKVIRKHFKTFPNQQTCQVDLGKIYSLQGQNKKRDQTWNAAIDNVSSSIQVTAIATAFSQIKQPDLAIKTYLKGRKTTNNKNTFHFELAKIYGLKGQKQQMIDEYLDALSINNAYLDAVKGGLQLSFGNYADEAQNQLVKTSLIKRIQKNSDKVVYAELLIWLQLQQHDYNGAFLQAKAIDRRKREEGKRILELADLFAKNEAYALARKAYEYVIAKGENGLYHTKATLDLLDVQYTEIVNADSVSLADKTLLENNYLSAIKEFGAKANVSSLYQNLGHFQAFYLDKIAASRTLLEQALNNPNLSKQDKASLKLELADILLMDGDIWDASLLYSQVEKAFKYDKIGHEAKFRNAKVAYYASDFEWAETQLKVLKGATTKLIANDAMSLSIVISDALAIDTNTAPLTLFARADLLSFQRKYLYAMFTLDSINMLYPNHAALADDVLYEKATIYLETKRFSKAAECFERVVNEYGQDILADKALFKLAELYENTLNNKEKAKESYQRLLENYSDSLFVVEARKRLRNLIKA